MSTADHVQSVTKTENVFVYSDVVCFCACLCKNMYEKHTIAEHRSIQSYLLLIFQSSVMTLCQ